MFAQLERPTLPLPKLRQLLADVRGIFIANGFIGWLFAATAPVAIILSVGAQGSLSESQLASWIFGVFCINGAITLLFSWLFRQPLAFFWTIPGTVLVGPALAHLSFAEVIGAYYVTGIVMVALGASGLVRRAMKAVPMPIVMGMVAGVFLRFGLDLVRALKADIAIAAPMVVTWVVLSSVPKLGRRVPPIIGALIVGVAASLMLGRIDSGAVGAFALASPVFQAPVFSIRALVELVIPLAITVLVVQNGQGFAVLKTADHEAPIDAVTVACGVGTLLSATVGGVCSCLAGPTNAILVSSGERNRQYIAGMVTGALSIVFGILSPPFTRFMLHAPKALIMVLAGLAMLRVLQGAFSAAFKQRFTLGALVSFLVTVADISLFDVGAAFWGLIAGVLISLLLEKHDFVAAP